MCDDSWDISDASVVCQEMGYPGAIAANHNAAYGQGIGAILLDGVQCSGREPALLSCPGNPVGVNDCRHNEDAGVVCIPKGKLLGVCAFCVCD